ncbi:RNA methyltransferase [uncultured Roseibium sp.]|uniref:RNA methyltransferase n=1 Tax=uncultured Roseibium sp. TaxID=1936171 RepID=UPI00260851A0|nr:RNA methyltransferase [uncultured Roseibium sp.]
MRGYSAIGLVRPKTSVNVGSVLRAAQIYEAGLVVVQGARCEIRSSTDTMKAYRHLPVQRTEDLHNAIPFDCVPVGIDLVEGAESLFSFQHPQRAFYVFGPEDGTLGKAHLNWCKHRVMVPTKGCMNLAATVNVVLYDRAMKADRMARGQKWSAA